MSENKKELISIPLDIPEVEVLQTEITSRGDFVITVKSKVGHAICGQGGKQTTEFHCYDRMIPLRHLPILGRAVYIRLRPQRYRCPYCADKPTITQQLSWYKQGAQATKADEQYLLLQLVNSTIEDVSCKEKLGYEAVIGVIDRHISQKVDWEEYEQIEVLGLDEIALKKGHRDFVVIVTLRDSQARVSVLAELGDRKKETVKKFLWSIPERLKQTIRTVCTDMYDGFINAVKEELGGVTVVADRFHVAKKYRACAAELRKKETRRLKKELSPEEDKQIKGAMWPFRKKAEDLSKEEKELLARLFMRAAELSKAYK